jgi:tRNA-specific 2-thiouridylase
MSKAQTRAHAARLGLPVAEKSESQDICFVEGGDYRDVLARLAPETTRPGDVVTTAGELVGTHAGIGGYTVGQRRGLPSSDAPRYVTRIDAATNTIVIGRDDELGVDALIADEVNLIRPERFRGGRARVLAMTRYRAQLVPANAALDDGSATLRVTFDEPHRAVTPGQLVALFDLDGAEVIGAATIRETF